MSLLISLGNLLDSVELDLRHHLLVGKLQQIFKLRRVLWRQGKKERMRRYIKKNLVASSFPISFRFLFLSS
jgi:hypothetical protein